MMTPKLNRPPSRPSAILPLLGFVALAVAGCQTLQYRQVQNDFQRAVDADNAHAESPFVGWYQGVTQDLTDSYIVGLPPKLQPNAWTLRAVSEWRSHDYAAANRSAEQGESQVQKLAATDKKWEGSRDSILLTLLPALIQDSQLKGRFKADGELLSVTKYETNYLPQFKAITDQLGDAREKCGPETPGSVIDYWGYQTWRILQNWKITIANGLPIGDDVSNGLKQAHRFLINSSFGQRFPGTTNFNGVVNAVSNTISGNAAYVAQMKSLP